MQHDKHSFREEYQVKSLHFQNKQVDTNNNILSSALHHANVDYDFVLFIADT